MGRERRPLWGGELTAGVLQGSAWAWLTSVSAKRPLPSGQTNAKTFQSPRGNLDTDTVRSGSSRSVSLTVEMDSITAPKNKFFGGKKQEGTSGKLQAQTFHRKPLWRPPCVADSKTQAQEVPPPACTEEAGRRRGRIRTWPGRGTSPRWQVLASAHGDVLQFVPKEPAPAARVPLGSRRCHREELIRLLLV